MSKDTQTVEIPRNAVALDATDTPLGITANILTAAPKGIRKRVYRHLEEFNMKLIARLTALVVAGPAIPSENMGTLKEAFNEALKEADETMPKAAKDMTPAMRLIAEDLADIIDRAAKNLLITAANENYVNHDAYLDIIEGHSMICHGLLGLNIVPADYKPDEETAH